MHELNGRKRCIKGTFKRSRKEDESECAEQKGRINIESYRIRELKNALKNALKKYDCKYILNSTLTYFQLDYISFKTSARKNIAPNQLKFYRIRGHRETKIF